MSVLQIVGWLLISAPFVGLAIFTTATEGPLVTLGIFAAAAAICGIIGVGVMLASRP